MPRYERDNERREAYSRRSERSSDAARQAARERLERRRFASSLKEEQQHTSSAGLSVFISSLYEKAPSNARHYQATARRFPPKPLIVAVAALLVLFLAVSAVSKACSALTEPDVNIVIEEIKADWSKLPEGLSEPTVESLKAQESDIRVVEIVNNAEAYAVDGAARQQHLFELVAEEPDAIDYVHDLPEKYPAEKGQAYKGSVTKGEVPLLLQWDQRWGYTKYCGSFFGATGCCPTTLSMVYMGLTGKTDKTPYDLAQLSTEGGYAVDGEGTISSFLTEVAPEIGLGCEEFAPSADTLLEYVKQGTPVIINVGEGDFTTSGHFIVAVGVDEDGKVVVNDPYSTVRSNKTWDAQRIAEQSINMYAFYKA